MTNMEQKPTLSLNATITTSPIADRIKFVYAAMFSPVLDTWCQAIKAVFLKTSPSISPKQIRKYVPNQTATVRGRMHAQRKNVRSTQKEIKDPYFIYNGTAEIPP